MRPALVALALLVLTACGDSDEPTAQSAEETTTRATTATTATTTTAAAGAVWTYKDSTGETFTVEDDEDTSFTNGVPDPVNIMEGSKDCSYLLEQAGFWDRQSSSQEQRRVP